MPNSVLAKVRIGSLEVSRFILGSNPISGFSHQSAEADSRMRHYFSVERIKRLFHKAESLGITTLIGRVDHHLMRVMMEYWDDGGRLQWFAQTCPEIGSIQRGVQNALFGGAKACFIHGGVMDHLLANAQLDEVPLAIKMIREAGLPAGIAGHDPEVFRWAEKELDVDFYMCSYYNPSSRKESPESASGLSTEWFEDRDRRIMVETIAGLSKPVIHYKVLAAGRNNPADALAFVAKYMRPGDAVCVGVCDESNPNMLREDVEFFQRGLDQAAES